MQQQCNFTSLFQDSDLATGFAFDWFYGTKTQYRSYSVEETFESINQTENESFMKQMLA